MGYYPPAIALDGTNDYIRRIAGLDTAADSKVITFSTWIRMDGDDGDREGVLSAWSDRVNLAREATNLFQLQGKDFGGTTRLIVRSTGTHVAGPTWKNLLISCDLAVAAVHLYVNDVDEANVVQADNNEIDLTLAAWYVGAGNPGSVDRLYGTLAELYFTNEYLDFSVEANRRKFIDADGWPVPLGSDGATPTGAAPLIYMRAEGGNAAKNSGKGGDFEVIGSPRDAPGPRTDPRVRHRDRYRQRTW